MFTCSHVSTLSKSSVHHFGNYSSVFFYSESQASSQKKEDNPPQKSTSDEETPMDLTVHQGDDGLPDVEQNGEKPPQKRKRGRPKLTKMGVKVILHRLPTSTSVSSDSNKQRIEESSGIGLPRTRKRLKPRRVYEDDMSDGGDDEPPSKHSSKKEKSIKTRSKKLLTDEEKDVLAKSKVENRYNCTPCDFSSLSAQSLLKHVKTTKHAERSADFQGDFVAQFDCETCSMKFFSEKGLARHGRRHEQHCKCSKCGSEFESRKDLKDHHKTDHLKSNNTKNLKACETCGKLLTKSYMKIHLRIHSGEKPFACDMCPFKTNQKGDLKMHQKRHYGIKDHKCSLCEFVTVRASILKNHMQLHTNRERTEECHICLLKFYNKSLLKSHIHLKHEHSRVHPCTFPGCTYKFKFRMELVTHMRTHTNEKPYLCSVCGFSGSTKQALSRHSRKHTGDKPFKCNHPGCTYMGRVSTHLTRHKRLHTGEKPYKCPYCSYRANTHENVRKHIRCTKKHAGLMVYTCRICKAMQTDRYQDLVDHMRKIHADDYVTFDKVSYQSGLLADKEEPCDNNPNPEEDNVGDQDGQDTAKAINEEQKSEIPMKTSEFKKSLEIVMPTSEVNSDQQIDVPTSEDNSDLQVDMPTSDLQISLPTSDLQRIDVSTSQNNQGLYKEFILCRVIQDGNKQQEQGNGTKNTEGLEEEAQETGEQQEIQMVTVDEGQASQAIEMILRQAASSGSHGPQDFIII